MLMAAPPDLFPSIPPPPPPVLLNLTPTNPPGLMAVGDDLSDSELPFDSVADVDEVSGCDVSECVGSVGG